LEKEYKTFIGEEYGTVCVKEKLSFKGGLSETNPDRNWVPVGVGVGVGVAVGLELDFEENTPKAAKIPIVIPTITTNTATLIPAIAPEDNFEPGDNPEEGNSVSIFFLS